MNGVQTAPLLSPPPLLFPPHVYSVSLKSVFVYAEWGGEVIMLKSPTYIVTIVVLKLQLKQLHTLLIVDPNVTASS